MQINLSDMDKYDEICDSIFEGSVSMLFEESQSQEGVSGVSVV